MEKGVWEWVQIKKEVGDKKRYKIKKIKEE